MSQVRCFSIVGDSNVRNYINKNSLRANPFLKAAQVLLCGHIGIFSETLAKIRQDSNCVIVSCVTNFLTSCEGPSAVGQRVEPVLQDVREALLQVCAVDQNRAILVAPPMYRSAPIWYREGLSEVMAQFSQILNLDKPPNLLLLPSFATPDFDSDGVHLTAYSGLEFVLHLFDSANSSLDDLQLSCEQNVVRTCESTRVLEDRVMVLEQDHRRLSRVVDQKTAVDAEIADFHENERMENFFMIAGLGAIDSEIVGKEWQELALRSVQAVILILMGREMKIVVVHNATKRHKDAEVTYSVKMSDVRDSKAIRDKFGSFFLGRDDKRPDALKHINIKNRVTPETRIRIDILKLLAKRYRDSNPGARVQVISYDPRPSIKIVPAAGASDRRTKHFNYVEAVRKLPSNFSSAEITPILRRVNPELHGRIASIFIVLSDDLFKKVTAKFTYKSRAHPAAAATSSSASQAAEESDASDATDATDTPEAQVPFIPQPTGSRTRTQKRGASSQLGSSAKK